MRNPRSHSVCLQICLSLKVIVTRPQIPTSKQVADVHTDSKWALLEGLFRSNFGGIEKGVSHHDILECVKKNKVPPSQNKNSYEDWISLQTKNWKTDTQRMKNAKLCVGDKWARCFWTREEMMRSVSSSHPVVGLDGMFSTKPMRILKVSFQGERKFHLKSQYTDFAVVNYFIYATRHSPKSGFCR